MTFNKELPQNYIDNNQSPIDKRILEQKEADLRDMFKNSKNPLDVLINEMGSEELRSIVDKNLIDKIKSDLQVIKYNDENDFVTQVIKAITPLWVITQNGKTDVYKQEDREMYTQDDVNIIVQSIKETGAQKIYISGNVGSGKTTLAREISRALDIKNIDLDRYFQIFHQETGNETSSLSELLGFVLQKKNHPLLLIMPIF